MSTLTEVLYEEGTQAASDQPVALPFSTLLQRQSYAACDNSGSTGGATLRVAQAFVNEIQVRRVSLWNSTCNPPVPLESVGWRSCGGTEPHTVFEPVCHVPQNASCFIFMTDGQVSRKLPGLVCWNFISLFLLIEGLEHDKTCSPCFRHGTLAFALDHLSIR